MKKFLISIWEFLTGGPIIKSNKSTDKGMASHTVYPTEPTKETLPDECYEDLAEVKKAVIPYSRAISKGKFKNGRLKGNMTGREAFEYYNGKGAIPKNYLVYHIDGDETNFHKKNLGTITRAGLLKINIK